MLSFIRTWGDKSPGVERRKFYRKIKKLGEGSYGVVKEAIDTRDGTRVAIKTMRKSNINMSDPRAIQRVKREMTILAGLKHENIVNVRDAFETNTKYYIVFDLATGGELFDRIAEKGHFTERDAARIIYTVLDALSYLHSHKIVHRDLKPENLLFKSPAPNAPLLLADFGVSNIVEDGSMLKTVVGSPGYVAPEVIRRSGHGRPADVWSVGIIAFILLSGYHPFYHAKDAPSMNQAVIKADFSFEAPYWNGISSMAKSFVRRLLQVDPKLRPTAEEALIDPWLVYYDSIARDHAQRVRELHRKNQTDMFPALSRDLHVQPRTEEVSREIVAVTEPSAPAPSDERNLDEEDDSPSVESLSRKLDKIDLSYIDEAAGAVAEQLPNLVDVWNTENPEAASPLAGNPHKLWKRALTKISIAQAFAKAKGSSEHSDSEDDEPAEHGPVTAAQP
ncbi:kinase-like domain-containing protein [Polychytrium aggregatum]|uniref:kinase-like domain-containing protein n=1 Tax=Polychytrium aggregatum TaxID=110093 RepID=UPI0022FE2EEB|nr:kinase-like domain-containing protein [Polychytrium aggregatum]KAI9203286.1 kinase-like domain-containing protein [Polychytrium aggregatum]